MEKRVRRRRADEGLDLGPTGWRPREVSGRGANRGPSQAEVGHWWLKTPWALQPGHQVGAFMAPGPKRPTPASLLGPVREEGFPFSGSVKNAAQETPPLPG